MVTTPPSIGSIVRATMVCNAETICAAITIGSMPKCGCAPCVPLPVMVISMFATAAMMGPFLQAKVPAGICGQLCMPNTISIGQRSNRPSFTMISPPARFSSAGWKIT